MRQWKAPVVLDAVRRMSKRLAKSIYRYPFLCAAPLYRSCLRSTCFIGVTGSSGKTTTKDLIHFLLSDRFSAHKSHDTNNQVFTVARTFYEFSPLTRYCVQEVGAHGPGTLDSAVRLLKPDIAVVTNVGTEHYSTFRSLDNVTAEKGKLIAALPPSGTAILNRDDPNVMSMAERCLGRVVTFGVDETADFRASNVTSSVGDGLRMTISHGGESSDFRIDLNGRHFYQTVLAAVATAVECGMTLLECARRAEGFRPVLGRMSHQTTSQGITFIRDDWKAPMWSISKAFEFIGTAPSRRFIVLGTLSDYSTKRRVIYRRAIEQALAHADHVVVVGSGSPYARLARVEPGKTLEAFDTLWQAFEHLQERLKSGDTVLLKGSNRVDHLARLALAFDRDVRCWQMSCGRDIFCDECRLVSLGLPSVA